MGTDGPRFAEIRQASRSGNLQGTEVFSAGIGMGEKNGVPPATMGFTTGLRPATPDEARKYVAQQAPLKPDFIKIWVDGFWGQYPKLPPQIYKAAIEEAHKDGLRVAVHRYHLDDARSLVGAGDDVIAHSIRDADIDDALLAEMKAHHVVHIPTFIFGRFRIRLRRFARLDQRPVLSRWIPAS